MKIAHFEKLKRAAADNWNRASH